MAMRITLDFIEFVGSTLMAVPAAEKFIPIFWSSPSQVKFSTERYRFSRRWHPTP